MRFPLISKQTRTASYASVAALLAAIVLGAAPAAGMTELRAPVRCQSTIGAGSQMMQLRVGGLWRSALVEVPTGGADGLPLVVALHGWGGSGPQMAGYSGLSPIAKRAPFVIAYPSSDGPGWNTTAATHAPNDVAFVLALVRMLERRACIDRSAVFATGVSNGGGMVALLGCKLSKVFSAIAPVAGGYAGQPPCHPARPVSVLEIHGTADQVVPYFGSPRRRTRDGVPPFVNAWLARDGCSPAAAVRRIAARTHLYRWTHCKANTVVEHIQIRGGRHQWPGAHPPDPGPPATICAACKIWRFFAGVHRAGTHA